MKRSSVVAVALVAVLATAGFVAKRIASRSLSADLSASAAAPTTVLGVEQFTKAADRYPGETRVEGVVSGVSPGDQLLTLIDRREFEECGVTTCAALYLPVRWAGQMPGVTELVRVEGQTNDEDGKLVFVARQVERVLKP